MINKPMHILAALSLVLATQVAEAKVYLNSMCTMNADSTSLEIDGDKNSGKKFPWASISKVATSLWAIEKLGPYYRYTTKFHINKISDELYDIHIEGGRDPIMGRNAGYFILSELNRAGVGIKKVRNLTFDQNFLIRWNLEEKAVIGGETRYYENLEEQTTDIAQSLRSNFATVPAKGPYDNLKLRARRAGISMENSASIDVENIEFLSSRNFNKNNETTTLLYRSAPLYQILKNMNNKSNNYISDIMFWNLGGSEQFHNYMQETMHLNNDEIEFNLGSGNNAHYLYGGEFNYNEGTCEAMIKIIYRLNQVLEKHGLELSHVMAMSDVDEGSTLKSYQGSLAGSVIAKTGTVTRAKTLAGSVSTKSGEFYFVVLMNMDRLSESGAASNAIKSRIVDLISRLGGAKQFDYTVFDPLPFDKGSKLVSAIRIERHH